MKKMKKKKKQGKKKFGVFFRRCFLLTLLAAAVVWGILSRECWESSVQLNPESYLKGSFEYEEEEDTEKRIEKNLRLFDAEGGTLIIPGLSERLTLLSVSGDVTWLHESERAVMLYQPETGEMIFSSPYAVAVVWQNGEKHVYFLRDQSALKQLTELQNFYNGSNNDWSRHIYSIYVKDDQFVLGEVFAAKNSFWPPPVLQKDGKPIWGEWLDLTPQDTSGWTKICSDYDKERMSVYPIYEYDTDYQENSKKAEELSRDGSAHLGGVILFGTPDAPRAEALMNRMRTEIPERLEQSERQYKTQLHKAIYEDYEFYFDLTSWKAETRQELVIKLQNAYNKERRELPMEIYRQFPPVSFDGDPVHFAPGVYREEGSFEAPNNYEAGLDEIEFRGRKWELFHFQYVDPVKYFKTMWLWCVPLAILPTLFLVICAALILSVISYLLYSRRYDIEAYRRNLTGALAHDLKTPLAVIYGHAENIRAHTHPESADEYADCIMENVTHMDEMIAGVLDLAQLECRAAPAMKEKLDLTELLHAAFLRNAALMEQRGLTLTESGQLTVKGNPEMLAQLCENLAANAVQHTAEGGAITVTAEKRSIRISNPYTGELDAKTLCEPFKRGDEARGSQSGSGLGLSIVQQIAALHKLRLRVTAKDGIFTIELKRRRFH